TFLTSIQKQAAIVQVRFDYYLALLVKKLLQPGPIICPAGFGKQMTKAIILIDPLQLTAII
nr:hypothetical protein [Bifidobacterium bifidum]